MTGRSDESPRADITSRQEHARAAQGVGARRQPRQRRRAPTASRGAGTKASAKKDKVLYLANRAVTIKRFSETTGIPVRTIQDWVYHKRVPHTKLCGRVLILMDGVDDILAKNAVPAIVPTRTRATAERKEVRGARRIRDG